ncbi:hypothetical protein EMPG_09942 [Blastomyces silverae]|uniref:Uncharacterized protein n=1 Tax=Blastomyces silverae TaxID=2060906 RepID=A0A0H1BI83_9EURO|nr:hypothetical protein EMPG_09942 [Blastomyces silverae]
MLEDRLRSLLTRRRQQSYEQLPDEADVRESEDGNSYSDSGRGHELDDCTASPFSWLEYSILFWMGVNMLWAWYVL